MFLGKLEVQILHLGRGHTKGDTVVWLPESRVLFSGDLVEFGATPYTGDAYHKDWPTTLDALLALGPEKLVPGRGEALTSASTAAAAIGGTRKFVSAMFADVEAGLKAGKHSPNVTERPIACSRHNTSSG